MINQANVLTVRKYAEKPFFFRLYLFFNLPMGFLSGMKIQRLNSEKCVVTLPFKWLNKNPFRSTFWATLGMAAEMSGAALILQYTYKSKPSISTLPINSKATFYKKAQGLTIFTCLDSKIVKEKVIEAIHSKKGITIQTTSVGRNLSGDKICEFEFNWAVKVRTN